MMLADEQPHFRATCRDGTYWMLALDGYDAFVADWKAGKPFWHGRSATPCDVIVKLPDITGVQRWTQEKLDYECAAREEYRRRELVDGPA